MPAYLFVPQNEDVEKVKSAAGIVTQLVQQTMPLGSSTLPLWPVIGINTTKLFEARSEGVHQFELYFQKSNGELSSIELPAPASRKVPKTNHWRKKAEQKLAMKRISMIIAT